MFRKSVENASRFSDSESLGTESIILLRGEAVDLVVHNPEFVGRWISLFRQCGFATVFQHPDFVCAWYSTYRRDWEPVILYSREPSGEFVGLWLLAWKEERRILVHAGDQQAEYHTWLARAGSGARFLEHAWMELRRTFSLQFLKFQYLPSPHLADLLRATFNRVAISKHARPLMRLDPESIRASFAKKSNKSRFNRLRRMGELEFRRVVDIREFDSVMDELIDFYDLRQGATHGSTPFRDDALKRDFHRALFITASDCVIFAVTYLAGRPIAAYWGLSREGQTHLGMLIHSPFVAEHSPGKLHLMQLGEYLSGRGITVVDLTPGGDVWKERFANDHNEVASAFLYASDWRWWGDKVHNSIISAMRRGLSKLGITPNYLRSSLCRLHPVTVIAMLRNSCIWTWSKRELRVYRADFALAQHCVNDPRVRCNSLSDLMLFRSAKGTESRARFLSVALARLEKGDAVWTIRMEGSLAHCAWTAAQSESRMAEVDHNFTFPSGSFTVYGFWTAPTFRGRGLCRAALGHILRAKLSEEGSGFAYVFVTTDNGASRYIIEGMGFAYHGSLHWRRRFGRLVKWADSRLSAGKHA
jgi:CelD/BcsL family acetyltransferase involved in cellulose biosynthesis/RimJ/RimL family protein N-acetyltransferase